jgi:hypothetical protein
MAKNITAQQKLKIQVVPKCPDAMECNDVKSLFIKQTLSNFLSCLLVIENTYWGDLGSNVVYSFWVNYTSYIKYPWNLSGSTYYCCNKVTESSIVQAKQNISRAYSNGNSPSGPKQGQKGVM